MNPFATEEQHPDGITGLGDLVALVAKPIAKAIKMGDCSGCQKRQQWLNDHVRFRPKAGKHVVLSPKPFRVIEPQHDRAIVIPWLSTGEKWQELRYALRSIHTHFTDRDCPIILIGDAPPKWLRPNPRLRHILIPQYAVSREAGLWEAWQIGMQIAREVLWSNDDIYFLRETGWNDLRIALTEGTLHQAENELRASGNGWRKALGCAVADLMHRGHSTVWRFATHTPFLFEIEKSREIFRTYHLHFKGSWVTLYHNHHRTPHEPCGPHKCMRLPAKKGERYLNHRDSGPDKATRANLMAMFPDLAPWEAP